jgi:nitrate reductase delta subunit
VPADRELLRVFGTVLSYPHASLSDVAARCQALTSEASLEAAALLEPFRVFTEEATLGELQEAYTRAFDLDTLSELEPTCYPYVGHHLFDENPKRSAFLLGLMERFREHEFEADGELADHLVVLLRFVADCPDELLAEELIADAILPAVNGMAGRHAQSEPRSGRERYLLVLRSLQLVLEAAGYETEIQPVTGHHQHSGWEH